MGGYSIMAQTVLDVRRKFTNMGTDELKWTKLDVKTLIFLQFLIHSSMWCHFSGMWIIESYAYWIIWILKNKMNQTRFQYQSLVWVKRFLIVSFNDIIIINGPLFFIIQFISFAIFYNNRVFLDTFKKPSNFFIFYFFVFIKIKVLKSSWILFNM
jgi:hypothetical protein